MLRLEIPTNIFERMLRQARTQVPIEACGILAGKDGVIEKFYEMTNIDQSSDHFMMEPKEQFKVIKDIRSAGRQILAICHSHPQTPARPSAEDIRLALTPDVVYIIVSLQNKNSPEVKGFLIGDSAPSSRQGASVTEVSVRITGRENE
jgi:proteasome lid subunit RPN8/RPN11